VVITNYNLGAYLPETLRSVAQIDHSNLEVVLVDDCSTEELDRSLLLELRETPDFRVVRNEVNRGLAASRNIGVRHASGEFVLPLDADDCLAPEFVGTAVRALLGHPEVGVVVPTAAYFDGDPHSRSACSATGPVSWAGFPRSVC
jgi:glycosyltransferase involved in cell wall biosynthesis